MSTKRIKAGKEAVDKLDVAQDCVAEAYELFMESGLSPRSAKAICKNYINDLFKRLQEQVETKAHTGKKRKERLLAHTKE